MGRKRKVNLDTGKPVRLSNAVLNLLNRHLRETESYDSLLRRILGLSDRRGTPQPREVFWVLPTALKVRRSAAEARGDAVLEAAKNGKRKAEAPLKVIEWI